jgi:crotonobetainyl-CoA:carnitine CoA-transferase CaiB-like acyl-CoA transferase
LGIDFETTSRLNPRLVYASITAFGSSGPRGQEMGFDPLLQARSGIMAAQGGHGGAPVFLTCGVADYSAAFLAAFGVTAALLARERSGRGQRVETSLAQAAMAVQSGQFIFHDGRPDLEDGGPNLLGRHPLRRAYRCQDGWIFVSAEPEWDAQRRSHGATELEQALAPGWDQLAKEPAAGARAERLARLFAERRREDVLTELRRLGIAAAPVLGIEEIFKDADIAANDFLTTSHAPPWGEFQQTGTLVKYHSTPSPVRTGPQLGQHSEEILRTVLGYTPETIQQLEADGAVITAGTRP